MPESPNDQPQKQNQIDELKATIELFEQAIKSHNQDDLFGDDEWRGETEDEEAHQDQKTLEKINSLKTKIDNNVNAFTVEAIMDLIDQIKDLRDMAWNDTDREKMHDGIDGVKGNVNVKNGLGAFGNTSIGELEKRESENYKKIKGLLP